MMTKITVTEYLSYTKYANERRLGLDQCGSALTVYIIKEFVLKLSSKFYASGGNAAKLRRITWG
jgi:hypothetical protein